MMVIPWAVSDGAGDHRDPAIDGSPARRRASGGPSENGFLHFSDQEQI
jgi:hypothetical protein